MRQTERGQPRNYKGHGGELFRVLEKPSLILMAHNRSRRLLHCAHPEH
jgi:hypothetical protein